MVSYQVASFSLHMSPKPSFRWWKAHRLIGDWPINREFLLYSKGLCYPEYSFMLLDLLITHTWFYLLTQRSLTYSYWIQSTYTLLISFLVVVIRICFRILPMTSQSDILLLYLHWPMLVSPHDSNVSSSSWMLLSRWILSPVDYSTTFMDLF